MPTARTHISKAGTQKIIVYRELSSKNGF
jgi:hypothetical protein